MGKSGGFIMGYNDYADLIDKWAFVIDYLDENARDVLAGIVYAWAEENDGEELFSDDSGMTTDDLYDDYCGREDPIERLARLVESVQPIKSGQESLLPKEGKPFAEDDEHAKTLMKETCNDDTPSYINNDGNDERYRYGWLTPTGKFYDVPWCHHPDWADEYLNETYPDFEERMKLLWIDTPTGRHLGNAEDALVFNLGWVLMHEPQQGYAFHTCNPAKPLTKPQREWLWEHYTKCGWDDKANAVWNDDNSGGCIYYGPGWWADDVKAPQNE